MVLLGIGLVALGLATVAGATKTRKETVKDGTDLGFAVRCPPGTHVVQASHSEEMNGTVFSSLPDFEYQQSVTGNVIAVHGTFYNYGKGTASVELDVLCSNGDPSVKKVTKTVTVSPSSHGLATAVCPAGTNVMYGGYKTTFAPAPNGTEITVEGLTRPTARSWRVAGFNYRGLAGPLEAIAYCGKGPKLTPHTATVPTGSYSQAYATAACPAGQHVLLGGFSAPYSTYGPVFNSMDTPTRRTWKVGVFDYSPAPTNHHVTAIAYCG